jgi:hypothetical protein
MCLAPWRRPLTTPCGHSFCSACWSTALPRTCPMCRASLGAAHRHLQVDFMLQQVLMTALQETPRAGPGLLELLKCGACGEVPRSPVTAPTGHTWCQGCFNVQIQHDRGDGLTTAPTAAPLGTSERYMIYGIRRNMRENKALANAIATCLPPEAEARLTDVERAQRAFASTKAQLPQAKQARVEAEALKRGRAESKRKRDAILQQKALEGEEGAAALDQGAPHE